MNFLTGMLDDDPDYLDECDAGRIRDQPNLVRRIRAAESRVASLVESLRKYGKHLPNCFGDISGGKRPCTCGLHTAISGEVKPND